METDSATGQKLSKDYLSPENLTTTARQLIAGTHPQPSGFFNKPPVILIRNSEGKNYEDTILIARYCGLTREEIGNNVTMRQKRDG